MAKKFKEIKKELEGKATLEDKRVFLEDAIKSSKGKTKEKLEKLLEDVNRVIDEEEQLEKNVKFLEQRLEVKKEEEPEKIEEPVGITVDTATYARKREPQGQPRQAAPETAAGLEHELVADRPPVDERVVFGGTEHKDLFKRDITYIQSMSQGQVLSTLVHYLQREGLDPTRGISSAQEQMIVGKVMDYFGSSADMHQIKTYLTSLKHIDRLPSDISKYKASTT